MAKGDAAAAKNEAGYQKTRYEGQIDPFMSRASGGYDKAVPQAESDYKNIMGRYQKFADTGGYNPEDISSLRARATSPIRAAYGNAEREVGRSRALSGGYSPNTPAVLAKMAREQGQAGADASTNVEAALAEMIRSGKMGGLQGMSSMYGTTPGMASMFGNQVLSGAGQSGQFGNDMVRNRIGIGQMPSDFDIGLGRLKSIGGMIGGAAMGF